MAAIRTGLRVLKITVNAVNNAAPRKMNGEGDTSMATLLYSIDISPIIIGSADFPTKKPITSPSGIPVQDSQNACRLISPFTCFLLIPMVR